MPAVVRVGHKGAHHLAPGNTLASFDAAVAAGVDMIEFDVLESRDGGDLVLAHDHREAARRTPHSLQEGLAHLAQPRFSGIDLDVDLKLPGYELRVVEALRAHGLLERALISTKYPRSLALLRSIEQSLRLGWSVPRARHDYATWPPLAPPAAVALAVMRRALPARAAAAVSRRRCDAIMAHWRLVTPQLVQALANVGGELYVWTVDDATRIRSLEAMGVTGVITNDPRLFGRADEG